MTDDIVVRLKAFATRARTVESGYDSGKPSLHDADLAQDAWTEIERLRRELNVARHFAP